MKKYYILAGVLVCCALGGSIFWVSHKGSKINFPNQSAQVINATSQENAQQNIIAEAEPKTGEETVTSNTKKYKNNVGKFSLEYPLEFKMSEYNERGGAYTLTFENEAGDKSFQIFMVPYTEKTISKERFALDEPSGVIKEQKSVLIDGITATMFFGQNSVMGETREVWFIKGGYLFEVTTYKNLDLWLAQIMSTWKFL